MPAPILLYDGVCGLCNRFVQFILRHDRHALFLFAALQSDFANGILAGHSADPNGLNTLYLVLNAGKSNALLLSRSDAVLHILNKIGGRWRLVALLLQLIPKDLRDSGYNFIARRRYQIFGRTETCPIPPSVNRDRFLDHCGK